LIIVSLRVVEIRNADEVISQVPSYYHAFISTEALALLQHTAGMSVYSLKDAGEPRTGGVALRSFIHMSLRWAVGPWCGAVDRGVTVSQRCGGV